MELSRPDLYDNAQRAQESPASIRGCASCWRTATSGASLTRDLANEAEEMARNVAEPEMAEMAVEELDPCAPLS